MEYGHEIWKVVYSCVAMHNFIRIEGASVDNAILVNLIRKERENRNHVNPSELDHYNVELAQILGDQAEAKTWRDDNAERMWQDYVQSFLALHPIYFANADRIIACRISNIVTCKNCATKNFINFVIEIPWFQCFCKWIAICC
jgi:hypothetical protein